MDILFDQSCPRPGLPYGIFAKMDNPLKGECFFQDEAKKSWTVFVPSEAV